MEALAAVGLASNILQFVELGVKVFRSAQQSYKSAQGVSVEDGLLERDASTLLGHAKAARDSFKSDPSFQIHIGDLVRECDQTAEKLITILDDLKVRSDPNQKSYNRKWQSFAQALRRVSKDREIGQLRTTLNQLEKRLKTFISVTSINNQQMIISLLMNLQIDNDRLGAKTTEKLDQLGKTTVAMLDRMAKRTKTKQKRQQSQESGTGTGNVKDSPSHAQPQQTEQHGRHQDQIDSYFKTIKLLLDEQPKVERQLGILGSLQFDRIRARQVSIRESHFDTFEWVFNRQETPFSQWLESENGIFWISGKPGSGKSTLMKFLVNHREAKLKLKKWGGKTNVIIASHYFWNAGNPMQKSRQGLLQTLLYEVLREAPELIQVVCGDRWANYAAMGSWDDTELMSAFDILASQKDLEIKFCFFVDGLDEYTDRAKRCDETFEKLLWTLKKLASSPYIKICASSRPWTPFIQAFSDTQLQLKVEDLTKKDIQKVVTDTLNANLRFKQLSTVDHGCFQIIETIVTRAKGVFLWVYLVLESLKKGLVQKDTIQELQKRLDQLPDDLQEYFRHMLDSIEPVYWESSCRIFRVMIESEQSLPLLAFHYLDQEMSVPDYSLHMATGFPFGAFDHVYEDLKPRLHARGHDLLFTTMHMDEPEHLFLRHQVDFLHRTVRDFFLDTRAIEERMKSRDTKEFNPRLSLSRIMLALTKSIPGDLPANFNQFFRFSDVLMYSAWKNEETVIQNRHIDGETPTGNDERDLRAMFELLDCLDKTNTERFSHDNVHWTNYEDIPKRNEQEGEKKNFLGAAIQFRLSLFVQHKIRQDPRQVNAKSGRPLLDYALRPAMVTRLQLGLPSGPVSSTVKLLLENGAKPNEKLSMFPALTPWQRFLATCEKHNTTEDNVAREHEVVNAMLAMISHGADLKSTMSLAGRSPGQQNSPADVFEIASGMGLSGYQIRQIRDEVERREKKDAYRGCNIVNWIQVFLMSLCR